MSYEKKPLSSIIRSPSGILAILYLIVTFFVIVAPMAAAVGYSFFKRSGWAGQTTFTTEWYRRIISGTHSGPLAVPYISSIRNSLFFGFLTVVLSVPLGIIISYITTRRRVPGHGIIESFTMLPLGISSIILGLGYIKAYQSLPVEITGKWFTIAFALPIEEAKGRLKNTGIPAFR